MQTIRDRSIALLGALAATAATVAAASPARAETTSIVVRYADLDLASPAGMATLRHRIKAAAGEVCGPDDRAMQFAIQACRETAIAQAIAGVTAKAPVRLAAR